MVLDRLFLWIFTVAVLVGTAGIILQVILINRSLGTFNLKFDFRLLRCMMNANLWIHAFRKLVSLLLGLWLVSTGNRTILGTQNHSSNQKLSGTISIFI